MVENQEMAHAGYVRNDHLDDGRELITVQMMLPSGIDDVARSVAIGEGMNLAFEVLVNDPEDEHPIN